MLYCTNRLAPNTAGWQRPTPGRLNSPAFKGYPHDKGFGHEDWNFNRSLVIDGFLYGYLYYDPAESKRHERFNFAFLDFNGKSSWVVGFYLDAQYVPEGSPKDEIVLSRKVLDLTQLANDRQLGEEWQTHDSARLTSLINAERRSLKWRVQPENAILLQTRILLPDNSDFDRARSNHYFARPTYVSQDLFDKLWSVTGQMLSEEEDQEAASAPEARIIERLHRVRERNQRLVKLAKSNFLQKHSRLFCEVCAFDFGKTYGDDIGKNVIEAHHIIPISQLPPDSETHVEDLAMVCANCHRMLHKGDPWPTLDELRARLRTHQASARV